MGFLPPSYRVLLALLAFLATLFVLVRVIIPLWEEIQLSLAERERGELELAKLEQELSSLQDFALEFSSLSPGSRHRLSAAIPPEPSLASWLSSLTTVAERSGVTIDALEQKGEEALGVLKGSEISVRARGTYPGLRFFLALLAENLRLTDLRDLRFEVADASSPDPIIQTSVALVIYYQPTDSE